LTTRFGVDSVTPARLKWRLDELGHGKKGAKALRRLLRERSPETVVPESVLERRVLTLIESAGLPPPLRQFVVRDGGRVVARLDFAYPAQRLAIEAEGYAFHSARAVWEKDLDRRNRLQSLGWRIIHVTWRQVEESPANFVATVRTFLEQPPLFGNSLQ
jgi:hypothetical protein